jgi:hypothetical protein
VPLIFIIFKTKYKPMAQLLYQRDSAQKHVSATRRHLRLCKQVKPAQALVKQITPAYELVIEKDQALQEAKVIREDRYDDMLLADNLLDDSMRNLFRRCEEYDRSHLGEMVLLKIFPDGKFSQIVNMNREEEPAMVEKLAMRLENLGEKHPLYTFATELRQKVEGARKAIRAYQESVQVLKMAETECEMACATLRRRYEGNYLDARKLMGKALAEQLFPSFTVKGKADKTPAEAEEATTAVS